jgi:hypothetical protein
LFIFFLSIPAISTIGLHFFNFWEHFDVKKNLSGTDTVFNWGKDWGKMDRVERELSQLETRSPTTPQRSHIKNGALVRGAESTTNLDARSERDGSPKRMPTKFAPGGIELIPQPSSLPADPLVCSMTVNL